MQEPHQEQEGPHRDDFNNRGVHVFLDLVHGLEAWKVLSQGHQTDKSWYKPHTRHDCLHRPYTIYLGYNTLTVYVQDRPEVISDEFLIKVVPCTFSYVRSELEGVLILWI